MIIKKNLILSMTALLLLGACDNTPTVEEIMADPVLRKSVREECMSDQRAAFDQSHKNYVLCKTYAQANHHCDVDSLKKGKNLSCKH